METFLVRLWLPERVHEDLGDELRGIVERPRTAESFPFRGDRELLSTLRSHLESAKEETGTAREERRR